MLHAASGFEGHDVVRMSRVLFGLPGAESREVKYLDKFGPAVAADQGVASFPAIEPFQIMPTGAIDGMIQVVSVDECNNPSAS